MTSLRVLLAVPVIGWTIVGCGSDAMIAMDYPDGGASTGSGGRSGSTSSGGAGTSGPSGSTSTGGAGVGGAGTGGAGGSTSSPDGSAGSGSSGPDGSVACVNDIDCPSHSVCGYPESDGCSAKGRCFPASMAICDAISLGCACDGTSINTICNGYPAGYVSKPLRNTGACSSSDSGGFHPEGGMGPGPVVLCPPTFADASNKTCTHEGQACPYAQGYCICGNSSPRTNPPLWSCAVPMQGCPISPPTVGSSCTQPGLRCDYGFCSGGALVDCTNGTWQKGVGGACPG
jgi:hypothetical protein